MDKVETRSAVDQNAGGAGSGSESSKKVDGSADDKRGDTVEYGTYSRVLSELKDARADLAKHKTETEEKELDRKKSQGKYKEMFEEADAKNKRMFDSAKKGAKISVFERELVKVGCDPDYVTFALAGVNLEKISMDEQTYEVDGDQVKHEVTKLRDQYPKFFGDKVSAPRDGTPGGTVKADVKPLSEWSDDELKGYLKTKKRRA